MQLRHLPRGCICRLAPVPTCGSANVQITKVTKTSVLTSVKVVIVDAAQWLGGASYGEAYVGFANPAGSIEGPYQFSRGSGGRFTADDVGSHSTVDVTLTNEGNTITYCQQIKNI
jgi:hypothetical protein